MKAFIEQPPFVVANDLQMGMFDGDAIVAEAKLLATLDRIPPGSLQPIDFSGTSGVASAAARRLLKRALQRITGGELEDRFLILTGLGRNRDNIQIMLKGEGLLLVERLDAGKVELRGAPDVAVGTTFDLLLMLGSATANKVKEELALNNISTATNRLTTLLKLGIARRIDYRTVPGGGREFVYAPVR
jgi:hypothetical protein